MTRFVTILKKKYFYIERDFISKSAERRNDHFGSERFIFNIMKKKIRNAVSAYAVRECKNIECKFQREEDDDCLKMYLYNIIILENPNFAEI